MPNLWPILIARSVTLMMRHGRGPTHALLFAWFATALAALGAHATAARYARVAARLMDTAWVGLGQVVEGSAWRSSDPRD